MITSVAVLAMDGIAPFELGVASEVFGVDRGIDGLPRFNFNVCSIDGKPVRTSPGFNITPDSDLDLLSNSHLVIIPSHPVDMRAPAPVIDAILSAAARGAYLVTGCTGSLLLGDAGLLDGRRCTTHWRYAAALAHLFPAAEVLPDAFYVEDNKVVTSAGGAAAIDCCLHVVRSIHGTETARKLARLMVVPPYRDGGQTQFAEAPMSILPSESTLGPLLAWVTEHLEQRVTIEDLAMRAGLTTRTLARRFKAETGASPHAWVAIQRILRARKLLEGTYLDVETIAALCGMGSAVNLRQHFLRQVGATPMEYRRMFQTRC